MRTYKKKRHIISDSRDSKGANDLRKTLNATERQAAKKSITDGLQNDDYDEHREYYETTTEALSDYNIDIAMGLKSMLLKVAPETAWADTDDNWGYGYHHTPRGLSAMVYKMSTWRPEEEWEMQKLILKIFSER